MPIISKTRPDPTYYVNIVQYDNGDWAADPMPLDDTMAYPAMGGYAGSQVPGASGTPGVLRPGLRTLTAQLVTNIALSLVNRYAPPDYQRNFIHIMTTTPPTDPGHISAKAAMDWIAAVNTYRDQQIAYVKTLNFNQIVAYILPSGCPPWPTPPAGLTPVLATVPGTASHQLRFG